ncbi:hypothetical protein D3C86_1976910 [compost metagenome]
MCYKLQEGITGHLFEQGTEMADAQVRNFRNLLNTQILMVVVLNVPSGLVNHTASVITRRLPAAFQHPIPEILLQHINDCA